MFPLLMLTLPDGVGTPPVSCPSLYHWEMSCPNVLFYTVL